MAYTITDLGLWETYKPSPPPPAFAEAIEIGVEIGFSRRSSDHVDWYEFASTLPTEGAVFLTVVRGPDLELVSSSSRQPSIVFPGNGRLLQISGYDAGGAVGAFRGKAYDPAANTLSDPPPLVLPIVPVSDRQFAQVLAIDGKITQDEALAWAARGDLPDALENAIAQLPEAGGQRFAARMLLSAATSYDRAHPLVGMLGGLLGYDTAALDDLWRRGAAL